MIIKREKIVLKNRGIHLDTVKRTSYWLFGLIPLYIDNKIINHV